MAGKGKPRDGARRPKREKDDKPWKKNQTQGVRLLQGEDRLRRLQGRGLAAEVRVRARQDPRAPGDGQLRAAPARRGHRRQERSSDGAPAVLGAMKVILQKPVEKLGDPGDVVEVAAGYARNYLVPRGLAVRAEKGALKHAENLKRAHASRQSRRRSSSRPSPPRSSRPGSPSLRAGGRGGQALRLRHGRRRRGGDRGPDRRSRWTARTCTSTSPSGPSGRTRFAIHLFPEVEPVLTIEVAAEDSRCHGRRTATKAGPSGPAFDVSGVPRQHVVRQPDHGQHACRGRPGTRTAAMSRRAADRRPRTRCPRRRTRPWTSPEHAAEHLPGHAALDQGVGRDVVRAVAEPAHRLRGHREPEHRGDPREERARCRQGPAADEQRPRRTAASPERRSTRRACRSRTRPRPPRTRAARRPGPPATRTPARRCRCRRTPRRGRA